MTNQSIIRQRESHESDVTSSSAMMCIERGKPARRPHISRTNFLDPLPPLCQPNSHVPRRPARRRSAGRQ